MDVTVIINRLLAEFATKYGLPSLALNQEGLRRSALTSSCNSA